MRAVLMGVAVVTLALLCTDAAMAQPPGSVPTVVSKGTAPGNGDANEDGVINIFDFVKAMAFVGGATGNLRSFQQADANLNGRVDNGDARLIMARFGSTNPTPLSQFNPGDANGDGNISAVDALVVTQYLENMSLAIPLMLYNADANQDYFVDGRDVNCIMSTVMRMVVGGQRCY